MKKTQIPKIIASRFAAVRTRPALPAVLTVGALAYQLVGGARPTEVGVTAVAAALMAWWGFALARNRLQRATGVDASITETANLLEQRNRQLQIVLQASRSMSTALNLPLAASTVVEQVVAYTRFTQAALILTGDSEQNLEMAGSAGLPEQHLTAFMAALQGPKKASSPVEWCRLTRQPVVVEDLGRDFRTAGLSEVFAMAGLKGMIACPLIWRDQFRGALLVYLDNAGPISTGEVSLVSALAGQAAITLENARLFTATAQSHQQLDHAIGLLETAAAALARTKAGVQPMLRSVAGAAAQLFAPARVRLVVTSPGRPAQVVSEAAGWSQSESDPPARTFTLPITLDDTDFGTFELSLPAAGRQLDAEAERSLQAFVHLTASALGNAALVTELRQAVAEVERAYMGTLEALIKALEIRDHETEGHSRRVVQYTLALAQHLGVAEEDLVPLMRGALLHDIGKIGIPDAILRKPEPLSEPEWAVMKQHTLIGYQMLRHIDFLSQGTPVILHHHERFDGKGYPSGLSGEAIPFGARIFSVADAYDAMTSDRPYRRGRSHEEAVAEIVRCSGTQFDPRVVQALLALPEEELARIRGRDLELVR